jgi:MerR family transcriptional regulator, redox-sensitive transcriptional activator SoxR
MLPGFRLCEIFFCGHARNRRSSTLVEVKAAASYRPGMAEDDDWHESGLTVGQVAQRMNVAPSAVRWYDDRGLLPSERTSGNQRRFFADVLCRVAMIKAAQRVGLSIEEIREALSFLTPGQAPTSGDWDRLAEHLRDAAGKRISELLTVLDELSPDRQPSPRGLADEIR